MTLQITEIQKQQIRAFCSQYLIEILFVIVSVLFYLLPQIDLWIMNLVWNEQQGFFIGDQWWARFLYDSFKDLAGPISLLFILLILMGTISKQTVKGFIQKHKKLLSYTLSLVALTLVLVHGVIASAVIALVCVALVFWMPFDPIKKEVQNKLRIIVFLLMTLTIGGLVVEGYMKSTWDRARPRDVVAFGGDAQFTPAWVVSDQCSKNCSFVSGHAAIGFYFMVFGWVKRKKAWIVPGLVLGIALGITRVVQGGHFPSDVILPGFIVVILSQWLSLWLLKFRFKWLPEK